MFKSKVLILVIVVAISIVACLPGAEPQTTPSQPAPIPGVATVQGVEIQILENSPLQANAIVRGELPDAGCTIISGFYQERDGNGLKVTLLTSTDPLAVCAPAITPFEEVIALDVGNLSPARYLVNVNGYEQNFELLTRDVFRFKQLLLDGLNAQDYVLLQVLMDESLMISYWQSEGIPYEPDQAIEQLRLNLLANSTYIEADHTINLIELLGVDPVSIAGPQVVEASPMFVSGLGPEGLDESILFIAKLPDGGLYWHGMLFAKGGFTQSPPDVAPAQPDPVVGLPTTPSQAGQPAPTTGAFPTITILSVIRDQQVTILAQNSPRDTEFKVRMGRSGTQAIGGIVVDNINSRGGGTFMATFEIPGTLRGERQIAIRLESPSGYYSYNWFDNVTSGASPGSGNHPDTIAGSIIALRDVTLYSGPSKNYTILGVLEKGDTAEVTGLSPDGLWWRVICPDGIVGSCWVSAKPKFTKPVD